MKKLAGGKKSDIYGLLKKEDYDGLLELFDETPDMVRRYLTMASFSTIGRSVNRPSKVSGFWP